MKRIAQFFHSIETFLNTSVDYFDERVRTGKFVGDIKILIRSSEIEAVKVTAAITEKTSRSPQVKRTQQIGLAFYEKLNAIPVIGNVIGMTIDKIIIMFKFYAEIFIIFAITFPTAILLLNFFENATILFFVALLPVLFFNIYCLSALYVSIQKSTKAEKFTLWKAFEEVISSTSTTIYLISLHSAVLLEVIVGYFIFVLFFGYFFDAMGAIWGNSFLYWFVVVFIGSLIAVGLAVMTMVMHQAYFFILFDTLSLPGAIKKGWAMYVHNQALFFFSYAIVTFLFGYLLYWVGLYYFYTGIAITLFLFINISLFIGFLLRRRLMNIKEVLTPEQNHLSPLSLILIFFGLLNYILVAILVTKQYDTYTTFFLTQRKNFFFSKQLDTYTNAEYRYMIEYPHGWARYNWNNNSVTFYTNYTGTLTGGVWLNITVSPYSANIFKQYYDVHPGLISLQTDTKELVYKVSNISIQGNEGVTFTVDKPGVANPEYQTHYLIHKNNLLYELTFTTSSKDADNATTEIFERIINSFRFIN